MTTIQHQTHQVGGAEEPVPDEFLCPISRHLMIDPVVLSSGMTYEREAIQQWIMTSSSCPLTRKNVEFTQLRPNTALKTAIDAWLEQRSLMQVQPPTVVEVSEQCIVNPAAQPSTLELGCSNIPSLAHGLHSARSASQLVHILQQLQVLAWQSDHGKHTIARQPGLLPRLLRLLHSDACTVAWYTAELLGFLSLQETLLQAILTTHHAALDASATLDAPAHDIHPHLAALVKRDVDEQSRAAAAWQAWLASLHPDQRPLLLQPHVLDTLARMLVQGASLATKLAATRVVRSVALAAVTWLDGAVQCQPALAQVLRRLLDIAKDVRQPCIARTAATSAVANLAAAGGEVLTVLVLRHGGVDAAVMLMMHHDMQGMRWGARLMTAITTTPACAAHLQGAMACAAVMRVVQQQDEQCQEFACHALRGLVQHSQEARAWLVMHWNTGGGVHGGGVAGAHNGGQHAWGEQSGGVRGALPTGMYSTPATARAVALATSAPSCRRYSEEVCPSYSEEVCPSYSEEVCPSTTTVHTERATLPQRQSCDCGAAAATRAQQQQQQQEQQQQQARGGARSSPSWSTPLRSTPPQTHIAHIPHASGAKHNQTPPKCFSMAQLMCAQSAAVRLHACRLLHEVLADAATAQQLLRMQDAQHAQHVPPTLQALCRQLADPVEGVQVEAAGVALHACGLLDASGGLTLCQPLAVRGILRLLASPIGMHQQRAASLLAALARQPANHPIMCQVGVVHALVDLLHTPTAGPGYAPIAGPGYAPIAGAGHVPACVTAVAVLRTLASGGEGTRAHVREAMEGREGLPMLGVLSG